MLQARRAEEHGECELPHDVYAQELRADRVDAGQEHVRGARRVHVAPPEAHGDVHVRYQLEDHNEHLACDGLEMHVFAARRTAKQDRAE